MAVNENGNLLDDGGNLVVDHVWGNMPMQPNDVRIENGGELLDIDLDNHVIAYAGWNGCHVVSTDYGLITCGNCQASIGGEVTE